ncbi:MAG: roadblock/LC7 domain-containing protein [Sandaracinaceae bacterium]|nr:roadblock/LC7 domain-containing protein [Sandaracinaceae bacterium]MDW8247412.1 roadblock/LC7 domain-containing protein [Sandaracinaceae bacterium]
MEGSRRLDTLNRVLRNLTTESPDVYAAALVSEDGLLLASALPQHVEELRIAGMSATLLGLGARVATELGLGKMEQALIRGQHGYAIVMAAAQGTALLVLASEGAKLGLVFLDMSRAIKEISKVL